MDSSDNLNHALFIFKEKTGWGAIGRSRYPGLHGREPRFRSLRDLAWSYVDTFVDATGDLTGYLPVLLDPSDTDWRFSKKNIWKLENYFIYQKHIPLKVNRKRTRALRERFLREGDIMTGPYWW